MNPHIVWKASSAYILKTLTKRFGEQGANERIGEAYILMVRFLPEYDPEKGKLLPFLATRIKMELIKQDRMDCVVRPSASCLESVAMHNRHKLIFEALAPEE